MKARCIPKNEAKKEQLAEKILDALNSPFKKDSVVYASAKAGLRVLSLKNLVSIKAIVDYRGKNV